MADDAASTREKDATTSNDESPSPSTNNSTNVDEQEEEHFTQWKQDNEKKCIINNIIVNHKKRITVSMISDSIAWNICNLRKPASWKIPEQIIAGNAKVKSVIWIKNFKKYVMAYMKEKWKAQYVRIYHLPKYSCLRKDNITGVTNYNSIVTMTNGMESQEVSCFDLFCLILFFN